MVDALTWTEALARIQRWARRRDSRYVCLCNVHAAVTAASEPALEQALAGADMTAPDGMPVALYLRALGHEGQQRLSGPDLMWRLCEAAERARLPIYLFGSTQETLDRLRQRMLAAFPRLRIAGAAAPPFRPLTEHEEAVQVEAINASGARIVFVGLGCPRQEVWMARMRGRIQAVMLGVGAAFDYHAGTLRRAPLWMQSNGLEWAFRLAMEPRRLWRRYLWTNSVFLLHVLRRLVTGGFSAAPRAAVGRRA